MLLRSVFACSSIAIVRNARSASFCRKAWTASRKHANGQLAEFNEQGVRWLGLQFADGEDLAGDAFRVIANPFQLLVDLDRGEDESQVARDRLVPHQEFQAQPVQFGLPFVEILVAQDDAVSQLPVALHQRLQARPQSTLAQPGHLADFGPNEVRIPLK